MSASCTLRSGVASTTNAGTYASASFTPTAGDLLVVFFVPSANLQDPLTALTSSANGITFTKVTSIIRGGVDVLHCYVANQLLGASPAAMTVTADCSGGGSASGGVIFVFSVSGMSKVGLAAVRQSTTGSSAANGTPSAVFTGAVLSRNPVLALVSNSLSPAGITPPSGFTEPATIGDIGYSTPTRGAETCFVNSGSTLTTVTWGATSTSDTKSIAVELDTTTTVTATRSTTWRTLAGVVASRATTWRTLAAAVASRATTWRALASVASTRSTTWRTLAAAVGSRATTWRTLHAVNATRATTWAVKATATATRSTVWRVLAGVASSRATTWRTLASTTASRATTWRVLQGVTAARSTGWAVLQSATSSRSTSWRVLGAIGSARATAWRTLASAVSSRATTWAVLVDSTPVAFLGFDEAAQPAIAFADHQPDVAFAEDQQTVTYMEAQ